MNRRVGAIEFRRTPRRFARNCSRQSFAGAAAREDLEVLGGRRPWWLTSERLFRAFGRASGRQPPGEFLFASLRQEDNHSMDAQFSATLQQWANMVLVWIGFGTLVGLM